MKKDTANSKVVISVEGMTAAYGEDVILKDITFKVYAGEIFVILGGSGCGKSTLLKHLIGLYRPAKGHVRVEGHDLVSGDEAERLRVLKRIGVTYQSGALFGSLTLLENVRLPMEEFTNLSKRAMDALARMKLSLVGLEAYADYLPSEVSGGMQKRAALARALALDPAVLFLDEPSAGFDPITSADLDQLILRLNKSLGVTFVVVTHELPSIYAIADRVIMLDKETKTIVAEGHPAELRDHPPSDLVRRFFRRESAVQEAMT